MTPVGAEVAVTLEIADAGVMGRAVHAGTPPPVSPAGAGLRMSDPDDTEQDSL